MPKKSGKKILFIHPGWEQKPLLEACFHSEHIVYATGVEKLEGYSFAGFLKSEVTDFGPILEFAISVSPDAVISDQCDYSHFAQSFLSQVLKLPGPSLKAAQLSFNKALQRQRLQDFSVQVPEFALCYFLSEVEQFGMTFGFPIVLKPVDNRGSIGVSIIDCADDIENAYYSAIKNSPSRSCIVERFIVGQEYSVDGAFLDGTHHVLAIGKKKHLSPQVPVAVEICYENIDESEIFVSIVNFVSSAIGALGYEYGLTHTEIICDQDGKLWVVESANRGGGCLTSEVLVPAVSGVDVNMFLVNQALGLRTSLPKHPVKAQVCLKFFTLPPGIITELGGWEEVISQKQVLYARLSFTTGDEIHQVTNDGNRHGFLIYELGEKNFDDLLRPLSITYQDS